jgi:hypothetical protein
MFQRLFFIMLPRSLWLSSCGVAAAARQHLCTSYFHSAFASYGKHSVKPDAFR